MGVGKRLIQNAAIFFMILLGYLLKHRHNCLLSIYISVVNVHFGGCTKSKRYSTEASWDRRD